MTESRLNVDTRAIFQNMVSKQHKDYKYIFLTDDIFFAESLYLDFCVSIFVSNTPDVHGFTTLEFSEAINDIKNAPCAMDYVYIPLSTKKLYDELIQILKNSGFKYAANGWRAFSRGSDYYQQQGRFQELKQAAEVCFSKISGTNENQQQQTGESKIRWFNEIEESSRHWYWYPYIRRRTVSALTATQGTGKSTMVAYMAAMSSLGKLHTLPFQDLHNSYTPFDTEPETSLLFCAEDDPNEDIKPQLRLAGADQSKIAFVPAQEMGINFYSQDIEEMIKEVKPSLIAFDPVQQFFTGLDPYGAQLNMNDSACVRPILTKLKVLAQKYDCAVIIVCHPNKAIYSSALHSTMGSNDFTAAPRSSVYIGRNPEDKEQRILTITKSNGVPDQHQKSLAYRIDYKNGLIVWEGESPLQADDIRETRRNVKKDNDDQPKSELQRTKDLIDDFIDESGGYALVKDITAFLKENGVAPSTQMRARTDMKHLKSTAKGAGRSVYWYFEGHEPPEQLKLKGV